MARQNVGTPRFYISWGDYWKSQGADVPRNHTISPYETYSSVIAAGDEWESYGSEISTIPANGSKGANFLAVLNHNLSGETWKFWNKRNVSAENNLPADADYGAEDDTYHVEVVNSHPQHTGFSIHTHNGTNEDYSGHSEERITSGFRTTSGQADAEQFIGVFGCFVWGKYYDMPHSPDLNLKLTYEYDGVKTIQTKGGATLSNALYTKPADWGDRGAWQLGDVDGQGLSNLRSGRRVWDLSFSYLNDSDIMPNLGVQNYDGAITEDILSGTDFFSQVINKTMGGHLPFIFQPDGANADPKADGFAICRFDMKSFSYDQVANNVYNVKLKIREVW